uniref:Uncharacterized protein n=1 Tax=Tetradesmus obliquus TaxID=3088 RepID=A0A383W171_TETOB|eukprot:jgi/Sobl393_1/20045/SZX71435.1
MFELLSSCSRHLGVAGLARVAASSKQLNDTCIIIARRDVQSLLQAALQQATAAASGIEQDQHLQAVLWLLQAAPAAAAAASVSEQLVRLTDVPNRWVLQLVTAGVRIMYPQLLAAASSMVPGMEVWVQAQQQLGVQTDMPAAAVDVCCGDIAAGALNPGVQQLRRSPKGRQLLQAAEQQQLCSGLRGIMQR